MIEVAKEVRPFVKADEVLAYDGCWAVMLRESGEPLIACRIRRPREGSDKDPALTVRIDALRRYGDLCWIQASGRLWHKGRYAHAALGQDSREWRIAVRLFDHLAHGVIPQAVTIVPDEAFERERCLKFQLDHPDVWQWLIGKTNNRPFNEKKIALIKRFGWLTEGELASIRKTREVKAETKLINPRLPPDFDDF